MTTTVVPTTARGHQLGHDISQSTSPNDALRIAGLDWGLRVTDAADFSFWDEDRLVTTSIPGRRFVRRTDNDLVFDTVGGKYTPLDNRNVFALGQHLAKQGAVPSRAGEIDHGRRVFMDFDFPGKQVGLANGKDLINWGAQIKAAHDGSGKVVAEIKGTRLWCTNGCTVAMKGIPHVFSVGHTASAEVRMQEAGLIMAGAGRYIAAFTGAAERMLNTPMTVTEFEAYCRALFPEPKPDAGKRERTMWELRQGELLTLFRFAETNDLGRGKVWGGFNAVTEYLDWATPVRQGGAASLDEARALRRFDNANQALRDQAFALAA